MTANLDTQALRALQTEACNETLSLFMRAEAYQRWQKAAVEAAPALLDAAEERDKYRTAASVLCGAHIGLPQASCPVCERDALRSEVERLREALNEMTTLDCGCVSGDCPHMDKADCWESMAGLLRDTASRARAALRSEGEVQS
jgi:uncharacterized protein (UPF0210 family)